MGSAWRRLEVSQPEWSVLKQYGGGSFGDEKPGIKASEKSKSFIESPYPMACQSLTKPATE